MPVSLVKSPCEVSLRGSALKHNKLLNDTKYDDARMLLRDLVTSGKLKPLGCYNIYHNH